MPGEHQAPVHAEVARLLAHAARVVAISVPRRVRADLGLPRYQGDPRAGQHPDSVAGPAQPDRARCPGRRDSVAVRGGLQLRTGSRPPAPRARSRRSPLRSCCACPSACTSACLGEGRQAARLLDLHDRLRARPRVSDELQRRDRHARPRVRRHGRAVPVLQRAARLARRVPDGQRHVRECAIRQPAGGHREQPAPEPRD